jgi:FtsZ-binding cell division protein ZapB
MGSDELKIILEDVKEKVDTVIEGYTLLSEKIDRLADQNKVEHEQLQIEITGLKRDLNEHRSSTELHGARKRKTVS